jgi:DNA-binding HxlR family transcriptional regulator
MVEVSETTGHGSEEKGKIGEIHFLALLRLASGKESHDHAPEDDEVEELRSFVAMKKEVETHVKISPTKSDFKTQAQKSPRSANMRTKTKVVGVYFMSRIDWIAIRFPKIISLMHVMKNERFHSLQNAMLNHKGILCELSHAQADIFIRKRVTSESGVGRVSLSLSPTSRSLIEVIMNHTVNEFLDIVDPGRHNVHQSEHKRYGNKIHDNIMLHIKKLDEDIAKITQFAQSLCDVDSNK